MRRQLFQSITCTGTDNQTRTTKRQNTNQHKTVYRTQSGSSEQHEADSKVTNIEHSQSQKPSPVESRYLTIAVYTVSVCPEKKWAL